MKGAGVIQGLKFLCLPRILQTATSWYLQKRGKNPVGRHSWTKMMNYCLQRDIKNK